MTAHAERKPLTDRIDADAGGPVLAASQRFVQDPWAWAVGIRESLESVSSAGLCEGLSRAARRTIHPNDADRLSAVFVSAEERASQERWTPRGHPAGAIRAGGGAPRAEGGRNRWFPRRNR